MSKDVRKALMIAKGPVSSGYLPSRHVTKAEGGPVDDPSDPDYHAKVHQDLMWHSAHNRSSNYGAALYHHLMKQPDQAQITKFYEETVYPIFKKHGFPKPPEGPASQGNPKYQQAVSDVVKNWRDVPRNEEDITKAEGGEVDVQYDNPGGNWLKHQRENAEDTVQKRGNIGAAGALTAWSKPVHVDPAKLSKIPGSMNERPEPGNAKYDALHKSMSAEGYSNKSPLLVGINHRGEPHIIEGNHRAAVARDLGVKSIPVEFRWFAGGEQADGFKPEHIKSLMPDIAKAEGGVVSNPASLHQQLFKAFEEAPTNEGIEAAENAWAGGVASLGSRSSARAVQNMPGYFDYRSHLEDAARNHLGDAFTVYRAMPEEQYKAWKNGEDIGPIGTTLNDNLVRKWGQLAVLQKSPQKSHLVRIKATPESIVMRGHSGEHELVVDANSINANDIDILDGNHKDIRQSDIAKAEGGAVEETVPEAPHTLESQLQAFLQGKRKAVLYTHEEPAPPEGAQRLETAHGVFHYNPALIDERSIKAAVAGDRINEILGYGPYSKKDVLNRVTDGDTPLAVVGRDAEGREVVAAAGTHGTANEQASAIAAQLPTGGQVHIESPQQVISERIAALRSPEQGNKDARKALMIARAMGGRIGKADGGDIDGAAPVPAPVTSGPKTVFAYGGKQYEFAVTPPDKQITSKDLAAQTTDALQQHLSLPYMQQVANSKAAANKLAPYVGREKNGAVKPFLTMNDKLEKASAGYEAGPRYDAQAPLELEGGVGVETIGMPLSPAYEHNKFKVCPNSAICKDECLGVTSGNYAQADWWPRQNSKNRTQAFMSEPGALAVQLHNEIQNAKSASAMRGNRLAVRLNVLSDIDPRVHENLIKANPDVDFYDYTKMNYDPIAPNHHYTYSSTGLSQPSGVNGLTEGVENKHQNWKQMRNRLDTGSNVAMVFSHKEHLPREVYDRETDKTYRVVDGTTHDYRPLDKQAEGSNGVIIGLQNLNQTGKQDNAYKTSNGFVVHYDPQVQMVPNVKTGLPTKTPVKGPSPGLNKKGSSLPRPTFPTNYRVEIAPQGGEGRADGGAVNHGQQKIHPDYAAQQFHNYHMFNGPESAPLAKGERPAQYAYGGPVDGDRQLDNSGFYNAAAEAAQGIPQAKGTPQQMMSMVQNAPGTQEAMKWSGADQAFAGQPIVSKDDLVKHFQTNAPKLEEKTFTGDNVKWGSNKNLNLVIPGGENYREVLLHLPPTINTEYRHKVIRADGHVDSTYDNPEGSAARANEIGGTVRRDDPFTVQGGYRTLHWKDHPNVVAHLRMSDRTLPQTNEKALHLEEVQSDWGQDGKRGFKKTDEELRGLRDEMLALHKNYLDLHGSGAPPDQLQAAESKYNSAMNKFNNGFKAKTPEGPYVGNTNKWTDLAMKRALIEAARGGHDKLIWTPGEEQALRYKENDEENDAKRLNGMNKYYGEIVPSRLEKILQSIGHKAEFGTDYIKGKTYDADLDVYKHAVTGKYHVATGDKRDDPDAEDMEAGPFNTHGEAVAHRDLLYKGLKAVPSLKITPAMRETISKGLPRKTGGFVPPARNSAVEQALKLTSKSGATLPAAVFLARQHQSRN